MSAFSRLRIRTKIIGAMLLLTVALSLVLTSIFYLRLKHEVKNEFLLRAENSVVAFAKEAGFNLMIGDAESLENQVARQLIDPDLAAALVLDPQTGESFYRINDAADLKLNKNDLRELLARRKVDRATAERAADITAMTLADAPAAFAHNGEFAYADRVSIGDTTFVIMTTAGRDEMLAEDEAAGAALDMAAPPAVEPVDLLAESASPEPDVSTETAEPEGSAPQDESGADQASVDEPLETVTLDLGSPQDDAADPTVEPVQVIGEADAATPAAAGASAFVYFIYSYDRIDAIFAGAFNLALILALGVILVAALFGHFFSTRLTKPINDVSKVLKDVAEGEGDLTVRLQAVNQDELGELCRWFNLFVGKLDDLMARLTRQAKALDDQAGSLTRQLGSLKEDVATTDRAFLAVKEASDSMRMEVDHIDQSSQTSYGAMETVSDGAKNMTDHISGVASSIEVSARNLIEAASAVEELSAAFLEMTRNMEHGRQTTAKAAELSKDASQKVGVLDENARNISSFVDIIDAISKQTNMLALNAAIEAASAGDAGKGFAVVANEVKDLAKQTTQAVQQIADRVEGIQESTQFTTAAIDEISRVMSEVSALNSSIVAAIEEQTHTVQEIHRNLDANSRESEGISQAIQESLSISMNMAESCQNAFSQTAAIKRATREILDRSKQLAEKATLTRQTSRQMVDALHGSDASVEALDRAAGRVNDLASRFKTAEAAPDHPPEETETIGESAAQTTA